MVDSFFMLKAFAKFMYELLQANIKLPWTNLIIFKSTQTVRGERGLLAFTRFKLYAGVTERQTRDCTHLGSKIQLRLYQVI